MRTEAVTLGACNGLESRGKRRVVGMGMSNEDVGYGLVADRSEERLEMGLILRPGIDDRDLAMADDEGRGAGEGEGSRIVAQYPACSPRCPRRFTRCSDEFPVEFDVVHGRNWLKRESGPMTGPR